MKVAIIAHTPDIEKVIASAAKLCYSQVGVEELSQAMEMEQANAFLEKLMTFGHYSPLEHASFTFAVEGVSRVLTHQLVRHRIASYSQQSQRYVKLDQFEYIMPPAIEANEAAKALFVKAMQSDQETYNQLTALLEATLMENYMHMGMGEKKARAAAEKKAIEDARFVFPNACETKIVLTMNLRSLHNFFEHRCCERAQWEIRALAIEMLRQVKAVAPTLFEKSGPSCVKGACKEGKMTCGKAVETRVFFSGL
ncbi:FAD-dependent thymidylate synthase [Fusibacter sp. 3D3]|uniref:FAD-dependent thymidylate synthase n=1 Tax=Fusibacter sp. 3D3 TaxID=1048380 RepID=UPI0008533F63|nr:FAD-dependent thymidylate synthase [Fusibacter sp. 3D3]GAU79708.1 thymidylate synthase thyX [Fusibacter sp. 3D3]